MSAGEGEGAYYFIDNIELYEFNGYKICKGDTVTINYAGPSTSSGTGTYAWADSLNPAVILSTSPKLIISPTVSTTYFLYTNNDKKSFPVTVLDVPVINLGEDISLCDGKTVTLDATSEEATYLWQDNSTAAAYSVEQQGEYWVEVTNMCGVSLDTITVDTICHSVLEMPNIFSPNNDWINDNFIPIKFQKITEATLFIYNRWGKIIFETNDMEKGWDGKIDGKECVAGTYYWIVNYLDLDGNKNVKKGFVELIK